VNPDQPRKEFDPTALSELSESIKVHGIIQPITIRRMAEKEYQIISGERRFRASKLAGLTELPAYIRVANDQELAEMALIENIQRENLNPFEIATTYARLKEEFKLTDEALAARVGKKRSSITNFIRLLKLPDAIKNALKTREITFGHARALAGVGDSALQGIFLKKTTQEGLSVRALENLVKEYNEPKAASGAKPKEAFPEEYKASLDTLRSFFGSKKVNIKFKGNHKGQIVVPFNNLTDFNNILDLLDND